MVPVVGRQGALARLQESQRYTVHQPGQLYVLHSTTVRTLSTFPHTCMLAPSRTGRPRGRGAQRRILC